MAGFSDARLQKALEGKRSISRVHYPGVPECVMGIRILSDAEHDEAREAASKYTAQRAKELLIEAPALLAIDPEHGDPEVQRQIIARAFVDIDGPKPPADTKPFFPSPQAVRQLPAVDREVLFQMYAEHQNSVSPLETLDGDQIAELKAAIKKEHVGTALLGMYDAPTLRSLLRSLVLQP